MSTDTPSGNQSGELPYRREDTLRHMYWNEQMSSRDIADHFDVCKRTILRWMDRNGIERRDKTNSPATYYLNPLGREMWAVNQDDKIVNVSVQRLTAVAEYGFDAVCGMDVHHIISIPWLNYRDNLQVVDPSEHQRFHNLGSKSNTSKLNGGEVREIKQRYNESEVTQKQLGDEYGVDQSTISDIVNGKLWGHLDS